MPSALTHPVVPLALAFAAAGRPRIPWPLLAAGVLASVLPDLDVFGRVLGVDASGDFGHRGVTHSLVFAALLGALAALEARRLKVTAGLAFGFVFLAAASHGLLDMATNGGPGVALYWPFSGERVFLPWRPVRVSPIGLSRFLHAGGGAVLRSEALWIWLPCAVLALGARFVRRRG
jgi:inner membrane protein